MRRLLSVVVLLLSTRSLAAQVGYAPNNSPYRTIEHGSWLEFYGGHMFGSGGPIPVGPRNGNVFGARIDFRAQHAIQLSLGSWLSLAERNVISATDSVATRIKGPVSQRLFGIEANVQFNITGAKSYHRLAPYLGVGLGVVIGQGSPASDTSGYTFGTKMYFAPNLGTRYFLNDRLFLKGEARVNIWKIKYPISYSAEPTKQPGTLDHPNAVNPSGKASDYAMAPKLLIGIGWAF